MFVSVASVKVAFLRRETGVFVVATLAGALAGVESLTALVGVAGESASPSLRIILLALYSNPNGLISVLILRALDRNTCQLNVSCGRNIKLTYTFLA